MQNCNKNSKDMDSQQPTSPQPVVKKVLVKKVKVLVKRPISAPQPAAPAAGQPVLVKVPVQRPVQQQPVRPDVQPAVHSDSAPRRKSFVGQIVNGVEIKALNYILPDNILEAIERREKVTEKLFLFIPCDAVVFYERT